MSISEDLIQDIAAAEESLKKKALTLKKVLSTVAALKTKLAQKARPLRETRRFLDELKAQGSAITESDLRPLLATLTAWLDVADAEREKSFVAELTQEASNANLTFGQLAGDRFLGPFGITFDFARQTALLTYAKHPLNNTCLLDVKVLIDHTRKLAADLLAVPPSMAQLARDFEEALKVVLARQGKSTDGRELRAPLPELFREMQYLRQDAGRTLTSKTCRDYPLARFVVELKTLIQSDSNVSAAKRFRLETAVIENTKNSKKSVFVPSDLKVGYGEGMYFQALVFGE